LLLRPSNEVFGICPLPLEVSVALGHQRRSEADINVVEVESAALLSILHLLQHSTRQISQYNFLALRQQSIFAILPVHTHEEQELFMTIYRDRYVQDVTPNWLDFVKVWSTHANGTTIFYKTSESLKTFFDTWKKTRATANTLHQHRELVSATRRRIQAVSRHQLAPPSTAPSALYISGTENAALNLAAAGW
jgi:hypothetical protein